MAFHPSPLCKLHFSRAITGFAVNWYDMLQSHVLSVEAVWYQACFTATNH